MKMTSPLAAGAAKRRLFQAGVLALAVIGAGAAIAAPAVHLGKKPSPALARAIAAAPRVAPSPSKPRVVWEGLDVDGDGAPDFVNPTGHELRQTDAYGCGAFGASRDGGERRHEGTDFKADAGQVLLAPMSGFVSKIGFAYPGDSTLRFVEISNPALHYVARVFYIDPEVTIGQAVRLGQPIGVHHSLEQKYPGGMTDHVHLEITDGRGERVDGARLVFARTVVADPVRG
jgi:hypothetical protein